MHVTTDQTSLIYHTFMQQGCIKVDDMKKFLKTFD